MRKILPILAALLLLFGASQPAFASGQPIRVYYAGPAGGMLTALTLTPDIQLVSDLEQAEVLVFNGQFPAAAQATAKVQTGAGLLLVLGPDMPAAPVQLLLGEGSDPAISAAEVSLVPVANVADPITEAIIWTSAPQVKDRGAITPFTQNKALIVGFEDQAPLLLKASPERGHIFIFTPHLGPEANLQFQQWAYFNYFIYHVVAQLANRIPLGFGQYAGSPVPHPAERAIILVGLAVLLAGIVFLFYRVRR